MTPTTTESRVFSRPHTRPESSRRNRKRAHDFGGAAVNSATIFADASYDGRNKVPVEPAKMMLGPCRGGAVHLADPGDLLMIGEGIETCLAAMQATGYAAWAALSTSGLRSLELPSAIRNLIVLADGDDPGEAAAQDCARRWRREGRRVRIARPPQGMDFNDLLVGQTRHGECVS